MPSWLKLTQWFWRGIIFKFRQFIIAISLSSPLGKGSSSLFEQSWNYFNQGCFFSKFGCHLPNGSGEDFPILSMYFSISLLSPRWKGSGPLFKYWNYFTQGCFVLYLVEIGPLVLEKNFKSCQSIFNYFPIISPCERVWPCIWKKNIHVPSLAEIVPVFWRRGWKCEKFTDSKTDGQRTIDDQKANLSFQLRWAKNGITWFWRVL